MNKKILISIIIVMSLLGSGLLFLKKNSTTKKEGTVMEEKKAVSMMNDTSSSRYTPYSKELLDQSVNSRRVLYFYASWCPTCRPTDADLQKNSGKIPSDVIVLRVNYNDPDTDQEEKDLAKKYGITYQHTFVQIDPQGNEITKWNGGKLDELLSNIK